VGGGVLRRAAARRAESALHWAEDNDLAAGKVRVERSWDAVAGPIEPKSQSGRREVPIIAELRRLLVEHGLRLGRREGLVFGRTASAPFTDTNIRKRAQKAWRAAGLEPIGLHEAPHLRLDPRRRRRQFEGRFELHGHSSITITLDRYGHLMPGREAEAVAKIDAYLMAAALAYEFAIRLGVGPSLPNSMRYVDRRATLMQSVDGRFAVVASLDLTESSAISRRASRG
jgi:hypothetical protein